MIVGWIKIFKQIGKMVLEIYLFECVGQYFYIKVISTYSDD